MPLPIVVGSGKVLLSKPQDTPYIFDPTLATFTAGMAKRLPSSGPFAAAIIPQGSYASGAGADAITIAPGTALATGLYPDMDANQGAVVMLLTLESCQTGSVCRLMSGGGNSFDITIQNSGAGAMLIFGQNSVANWVSTPAGSIVAGTTYSVVFRWDTRNTLDGTNYCSISINDSHTFGRTTAPGVCTVPATYNIGSLSGGGAANCIIQGLTIYRRPLFDGAYGCNVGNGDEIARIYNSGTFVDPTEITGRNDVVFCLPTNSTVGALATGTGEAWSNPWSSNLLAAPAWTMTDGFYGGGPHLTIASGTVNCGNDSGYDNLHDAAFTVEGWYKATGAATQLMAHHCGSSSKGWYLRVNTIGGTAQFVVFCATTSASANAPTATNDNKWHHIACTFDDAGDRKARIYIDGALANTSSAGVGAVVSDSSTYLYIGSDWAGTGTLSGLGWVRISNSIRYSADFVPSRTPPSVDANTVAQWNMAEGQGATVDNAEGTAGRDGTITNGTWQRCWKDSSTPLANDTSAVFNGTTSSIDCGSDASIDDLHDAAMTAECWFTAASAGENSAGNFFSKTGSGSAGWELRLSSTGLSATVYCATTSATATYASTCYKDNLWHHLMMTFDDAGDRKVRLFLDGILVSTSAAGSGAVVADASANLFIGNRSDGARTHNGKIGWCRLSNSVRQSANFVPPARTSPPAPDANTIGQWNMQDGAGTTVANTGSGTCTGTASNVTWSNSRSLDAASGHKIYSGGYQFGVDGADEGITIPVTGLTAGTDYVVFPVISTEGRNSQPAVTIVDDTNTATILDWHGPDQTTELVTNGGFDSDTTGWTALQAATLSSEAGGISGNCLKVTRTTTNWPKASQILQLIPYAKYRINHWHLNGDAQGVVTVSTASGGNDLYNSSSLNDAAWTERASTFYAPASGLVYLELTGVASGTQYTYFDSISIKRVIDQQAPWAEHACFELPSNARDGVTDCTAISLQASNTKTSGVIHVQQCPVYANLVDDGGMEKNVANGADVGSPSTSARSNDFAHTGTYSWKIVTDAANEGRSYTVNTTSGKYYMCAVWVYVATASKTVTAAGPCFQKEASAAGTKVTAAVNTWERLSFVFRATAATSTVNLTAPSGTTFYIDDLAIVEMTDVSLTVTPASAANSAESSGIRVDGKDSLTSSTYKISMSKGIVKWSMIPRHSSANVAKLGNLTPVVAHIYGNATNYIKVDWSAANTLRLSYNAAGGGVQSVTYDATGAIVAGTTYLMTVRWTGGYMSLAINGVIVAEITAACVFGVDLATAYWGSDNTGSQQYDAVYL